METENEYYNQSYEHFSKNDKKERDKEKRQSFQDSQTFIFSDSQPKRKRWNDSTKRIAKMAIKIS